MASSHNSPRRRVGTRTVLADGRIKVTVCHGLRSDGKRKRLYAYAESEDEAEKLALELASKLNMHPELGNGITLSRWWDAYKVTRGKRLCKVTLERYATEMNNVWLPALGGKDITLISHSDIQAVVIRAKTRSMAKERIKALSAVLTQAVRDGHLQENPCRNASFEMPGDVGGSDPDDIDYSEDPFAAIEGEKEIWDVETVLAAMQRLRGLPIETCWLAMIGGGLRREEALALRWRCVRRQKSVNGGSIVQLAVHAARTAKDGYKTTKTRKSKRIVTMVEPFGSRLWELRGSPDDYICDMSASNISRKWRLMWKPRRSSKHTPRDFATHIYRGVMLEGWEVPFVHLKQMRDTHATLVQAVGVGDSENAVIHGHSERVAYTNYLAPDSANIAARVGELFVVEGGRKASGSVEKPA